MWSLPLASNLRFLSEDQNSYGRMSDRSEPMFLRSNIHLVSLHLYAVNKILLLFFLAFCSCSTVNNLTAVNMQVLCSRDPPCHGIPPYARDCLPRP